MEKEGAVRHVCTGSPQKAKETDILEWGMKCKLISDALGEASTHTPSMTSG
jgi:hypothetical protein